MAATLTYRDGIYRRNLLVLEWGAWKNKPRKYITFSRALISLLPSPPSPTKPYLPCHKRTTSDESREPPQNLSFPEKPSVFVLLLPPNRVSKLSYLHRVSLSACDGMDSVVRSGFPFQPCRASGPPHGSLADLAQFRLSTCRMLSA